METAAGTVQLREATEQHLTIARHRGFGRESLDHFARVDADDSSSCGAALRLGARVVVPDVTTAPCSPAPRPDILLAEGVRATHSTPLRTRAGQTVGMVSAHHPRPGRLPTPRRGEGTRPHRRPGGPVAGLAPPPPCSTLLDALDHFHTTAR